MITVFITVLLLGMFSIESEILFDLALGVAASEGHDKKDYWIERIKQGLFNSYELER